VESKGIRLSVRTFVFAVALLLVGAVCLAAGRWLSPILDAQQAAREGRLQQAVASYAVAEKRFASMPLVKRVLPNLYDMVVTNELRVLYTLKQYDEVIDKAGATATRGGNFWAGCALFAKGDLALMTPDKRMKWLSEAQEEFRRAVQNAPSDFDAKFNYEVTTRVIAGARRAPKTPRPTDLNLLTPSNLQTPRKVG
jgi:hypothetical protein